MIARYLVPFALAAGLAMSCVQASPLPPQMAAAPAAATKDATPPLLDPAEFAPDRTFAPPPPHNSPLEALELQQVKALRAAASPERLAQAERDEVAALTDYNISIAELHAALGTALERNKIDFKVPEVDESKVRQRSGSSKPKDESKPPTP